MDMRSIMQIVEGASQARGEFLFQQHGGKVFAYRDLPTPGKRAIKRYFADEAGNDISADQPFGYVELPTEALMKAIGPGLDTPFKNFDEYHAWYVGGGDMPDHKKQSFAVILDGDGDEIIWDGWHRFHDYVRKGFKTIPCVMPL